MVYASLWTLMSHTHLELKTCDAPVCDFYPGMGHMNQLHFPHPFWRMIYRQLPDRGPVENAQLAVRAEPLLLPEQPPRQEAPMSMKSKSNIKEYSFHL